MAKYDTEVDDQDKELEALKVSRYLHTGVEGSNENRAPIERGVEGSNGKSRAVTFEGCVGRGFWHSDALGNRVSRQVFLRRSHWPQVSGIRL